VFDPQGPVLGIDPGLSRCGYGAITGRASECRAVSYGVLRTSPDLALPERLGALHEDLEALIVELRPSVVAVERVLFQANVRTAMSVGQASGLALAIAARAGIPVEQYSPNEVKLAVAGYGAADKEQVQSMVMRLLKLAAPPSPPDAADALALALCHGWGAARYGVRAAASAGPAPSATKGRLDRAVAAAIAKERR
jgi:crossover junction endodeoxyribonuclease RuvC